ncbi:globoside alpha-1,3-N-acetylgalactosaminyltransferase 1-like isoform X2 [Scleropages formosus]|uniref:globoside alpha-1,3-N-acetylgalactosaminyltransferase 1-like isoform X2 n=1 Tax=Scleropages formosus TaxID=113540 RepID=UPI0008786BD3|nr:globoside alpha-1,3-N-acetylgalactosaminyltransferase 1-like isoform X2 [Scleropages formosus]
MTFFGTFGYYFFKMSCFTSHTAPQGTNTSPQDSLEMVIPGKRIHDVISPQGFLYKQPSISGERTDVLTVTPWLAPVVWEGTFDPMLIDAIYKPMNLTVAATVFAVGKYIMFLQGFLESAERHFLVGFRVHYHIFTDEPEKVPPLTLAAGRQIIVHKVHKLNRWQDISASRMQLIQKVIEDRVHREAIYMFCLDVDAKFYSRWGAEALELLVAQMHSWFYREQRHGFTYERNPASKAYIPNGEGDFYYAGALFGGSVGEVYKLAKMCHSHLEIDRANGIEALWQEESHLNWYLLHNKPSKVLSPEYMWDNKKGQPGEIKVIRFSQVPKNYKEVRENA